MKSAEIAQKAPKSSKMLKNAQKCPLATVGVRKPENRCFR
jgi:hypothetical protein